MRIRLIYLEWLQVERCVIVAGKSAYDNLLARSSGHIPMREGHRKIRLLFLARFNKTYRSRR